MTTTLQPGPRTWSLSTDDKGYRTYKIVYLVVCSSAGDGPSAALATTGLPAIGSVWVGDNENDPWCWRRPEVTVTPLVTNEPNHFFEIEMTFSNVPVPQGGTNAFSSNPGSGGGTGSFPQGQGIENPLLVPDRVSGGFTKYSEEAAYDRSSQPILTSSHERIRGPQVEFDRSRPTVRIEQNRAALQLGILSGMLNTVNSQAVWGMAPRCVKFSGFSWEKKYYAGSSIYYTRNLEFDIRDETFDKYVADEGTKAINGHWSPKHRWVVDNIGALAAPRAPTVVEDSSAVPADLPSGYYMYWVTAFDDNTPQGQTLRSAPGVVAVQVPTGSAVRISWNAVPGAANYAVYRQPVDVSNEPTGPVLLIGSTTTALSLLDQGRAGVIPILPTVNDTGILPDIGNPLHFRRYKDKYGENARVLLDGLGAPAEEAFTGTGGTIAGKIFVQYYFQTDFSILGIPAVL